MDKKVRELLEQLRDESNCNVLDYIDDAADLIESLAAELEQVKRERDVATEQVKVLGACAYCEHDSFCPNTIPDCMNCRNERCPCYVCGHQSQWKWRGMKEG